MFRCATCSISLLLFNRQSCGHLVSGFRVLCRWHVSSLLSQTVLKFSLSRHGHWPCVNVPRWLLVVLKFLFILEYSKLGLFAYFCGSNINAFVSAASIVNRALSV
uniref:Secreted protein n=1 Tax=Amblyomma americanum TaxID=6943 RepID=A0A0C9R3Z4_AMBAM